MSLGLNILLIFVFLLLGSVFAGTELALVSLRGSQIDQMEQEDARGKRVAKIARDPNTFLSTVQIGVTLSGFLSASFGESSISPFIVPVVEGWGVPSNVAAPLTTIVLTLVISYCSIVISEMVPKRIAMQRNEQIARAVVPAISAFAKVCRPIIWLIGKNTNGIVRLLGFDPNETESEVSDEDCMNFYKEKFHDTTDPAAVIRVNAEGQVSYKALLFIPGKQLLDFMSSDYEPGLQLYSSGVMIMEKCPDLLAESFYFVRGIVDSPDLSLNISREMLQHDRQLRIIAQNLNKRIKNELLKMLENDRPKYEKFYKNYGRQLRYGAVANFGQNIESLRDLLIYNVAEDKTATLKEYTDRMPAEQKYIYYAVGDSVSKMLRLPQAELVRSKGFEILCMTEEVDEYIVEQLGQHAEKKFCNIVTGDLGIETEEEKADLEKREEQVKPTLDFVKDTLGDKVSIVRLSHKLVSAPVCLTTEGSITLEMERYFKRMPDTGMEPPKATRVLELNGEHPAFKALEVAVATDPERAKKLVNILHSQALLIAGEELDDPSAYAEDVCSLF